MRSSLEASGRIGVHISGARAHWASRVRRWAVSLHMWVGAAAALYIVVLCLSGCIVLFERELYGLLSPNPALQPAAAPRLSRAELLNISMRRYPEHRIIAVWDKRVSADMIAEIWLEGRSGLRRQLLNPYTGADLGAAQPVGLRILATVRQLHTNLVAGRAGRLLNAFGSMVLVLVAMSALLSWIHRRRKPIALRPASDPVRSWHRRAGVWIIPFALIWGATGAMLSGPALFGEEALEWAYVLHTGSVGGWVVKGACAVCAGLTSILVLAGLWTWWHKTAKRRLWRNGQFFGPPSSSSADDIDLPSGRTIMRAAATNGSDLAR